MRVLGYVFWAAVFGLASSAAWGQQHREPPVVAAPDPQDDAATLDDVVVEGRSLAQQAERFTAEAARPVAGRGLARWRGPVCIGVVNFRRELSYQIADGVAHAGGALGVPIADGECEANIFIIGTLDARDVASGWIDREYREFRPNIADSTLSSERLADFRMGDDPVRWWAISRPSYFDIFGGWARPTNGPGRGPISIYSRSLQSSRIRDDLQRLIVIIDAAKVETVSLENLIAYLTVVSFAQIDMRADMRAFDTVLNLFDEGYSGAGLTQWDRAYIRSLYAVPRDQRIDVDRQSDGLADEISNEREGP